MTGNNKKWPLFRSGTIAPPPSPASPTSLQSLYGEGWADGLPDKIYEAIFSLLSGKEQLVCRLVCTNWEDIITPMLSEKCCLVYKGRPKFLVSWLISKAKNFSNPANRFVKVCIRNPSLATRWDELRMQDLMPKSSRKLAHTLLSPDLNATMNLNNVTTLHISNSMYRFQRLRSFFALLPKLEKFSDVNTCYTLDWSICCKTFTEIQDAILKPFQDTHCPVKRLSLQRDDAGFKTLFLMKLLGLTCDNLESFELNIDTYEFPFPLALIDRMDYASLVGVMLNMNRVTLKEIKFHWVGHLSYHFYDDLLRCLGVMSWNGAPWNLTKVDFHFDWILLGNQDFHSTLVPFIQKLECLEELKMRNIILQPEWAEMLDRVKPNNYSATNPLIEFGVVLSDNLNFSTGQTSVNVISSIPYLKTAIKIIRVSITSECTDELKKVLPIGNCEEFSGTTELYIIKADWKPQMRFIMYNVDRVCETFKNLTVLVIADGDKAQYRRDLRAHKQWNRMSNAHIGDDDMQLILRNMTKLKNLRLRCRMYYLTDRALTGLTPIAIAEMKAKQNLVDIPDPSTSLTGVSFSHLPDLEEIVLQGLNRGITDITLYNGFKGMENLKNMELAGETSFSIHGKKWIKSAFPNCRNGFKECLPDGTWFRHPESNLIWSNYTTCINLDDFQWKLFINGLYEVGYCVSVFALALSLIIFCTFKCLECTRVKIHRNLFASFIIDNLLWVAWYRFIIANESVVLNNPWWCKWLFVLVQYFLIANYFWMFCEGFYLHTLLVFAFLRSESQLLKSFYVLGWLGPIVPIGLYIYYRLMDEYQYDQACWIEPHHQMFVTMPVCISLVLNLIFLINIVRVLVTKLNDQRGFRNTAGQSSNMSASPENQHSLRKAVRATLILIPLLGVHYLLLPFRPAPGTTYEAIYDVASAVTSSLQGLLVAILFCFCNTEVVSVFRRRVCPKFCLRNNSSPNHANRGDSAMPTSGGHTVPIINGSRRETVRGRVQSRTSVEMFEEQI